VGGDVRAQRGPRRSAARPAWRHGAAPASRSVVRLGTVGATGSGCGLNVVGCARACGLGRAPACGNTSHALGGGFAVAVGMGCGAGCRAQPGPCGLAGPAAAAPGRAAAAGLARSLAGRGVVRPRHQRVARAAARGPARAPVADAVGAVARIRWAGRTVCGAQPRARWQRGAAAVARRPGGAAEPVPKLAHRRLPPAPAGGVVFAGPCARRGHLGPVYHTGPSGAANARPAAPRATTRGPLAPAVGGAVRTGHQRAGGALPQPATAFGGHAGWGPDAAQRRRTRWGGR